MLVDVVAEIEAHVHAGGWDRGPVLFALVRNAQFVADDPDAASALGIAADDPEGLTPVEQEEMPDGPLDEVLASIEWPAAVSGCALSQEIVFLPPEAEAELTADDVASRAATHPERREARLVVAVLRDGEGAALMRMRAVAGEPDTDEELLTDPDLAPNLVAALRETFG